MQVFADDGARIDVRANERQHRNALVLIHGFPFSRDVWAAQRDALANAVDVVLPDLRGAGESSDPPGPYLMETLAADVALALDALRVERASIAGHSMGGYVALAFARMFTERVERLALIASRLRADTPEQAQARRELADRVEREQNVEPAVTAYLPRLFAPESSSQPEVVERAYEIARRNRPPGIAGTLRGMAMRPSSEDIAEDLEMPVLWIAGGADGIVPLDEARAASERFSRGRLAVCERSGHLPMMEEPERVSEELRRWLEVPVSG